MDTGKGKLAPSYGEIKTAKALTSKIDITVIIRPRGGDFLYTEAEVQSMLLDIELCKELKVHGVVFGCLTKDGDIDVPLMRRLIEAAKPLSVTCHRAFDVCRDPFTALEQLIELGCDRILTSGQQSDAVKGIPLIAELVKRADGRIIIMPGCGVRENNIGKIEAETGAKEFHTSARSIVYSKMEYRNENVPMGSSIVSSEFETVTNGSGEGKGIYLSAGIGVSLCRYWCSPTPVPASPHAYTGVGRYQYSYAGEMFFLPKKIVYLCASIR